MKALKRNGSSILLCIFEIAVGVLLLLNPVAFTAGIIIACGIILLVMGAVSVVKYFRMDAAEAAETQELLKGLILLVTGGLCACRSDWFLTTFPVLSVIYGIIILIAGLGKIQWAFDLLRMKKEKWFLAAVSAVISIVCAIVVLRNPFASSAALWMFTGISLIVEAVFDLIAWIVNSGKTHFKISQASGQPEAAGTGGDEAL